MLLAVQSNATVKVENDEERKRFWVTMDFPDGSRNSFWVPHLAAKFLSDSLATASETFITHDVYGRKLERRS